MVGKSIGPKAKFARIVANRYLTSGPVYCEYSVNVSLLVNPGEVAFTITVPAVFGNVKDV